MRRLTTHWHRHLFSRDFVVASLVRHCSHRRSRALRADSYIRSSVFNPLTWIIFIGKGVFYEEFVKIANSYFAFVVLWQIVPETTNTGSLPTSLPALTVVVTFASILKFMQVRRPLIAHPPAAAARSALALTRTACASWATGQRA